MRSASAPAAWRNWRNRSWSRVGFWPKSGQRVVEAVEVDKDTADIERDTVAEGTAEQFVNGHAEALARGVVERHIDARQRVDGQAAAVVDAAADAVEGFPASGDVEDVAAEERLREAAGDEVAGGEGGAALVVGHKALA